MPALVYVRVPIRAPLPRPVGVQVNMILSFDPGALFETHDIKPGTRQNHRGQRSRCAGSDNQDVADPIGAHLLVPHLAVRRVARSRPAISSGRTASVGM